MNKNFKLIEKRHVDFVDGDVYMLEHIKSGARILKVANQDTNKTFCISFKTEPIDDSGIPHILEHSVLNGSRKYPVKSPFDQLLKGSLSTFLNAMTGSDMTTFPMASVSDKDYFNLMDVYLDAVFNPMIYTDKRILRQEGWRIEAKNVDDPFHYTGVVYNEMKGNYSDPFTEVFYRIGKHLFPNNGYGFDSGGHPDAIPTLTQERFVEYHKKHYRPENSYIFLYGNADFEKELQILDEGYLSSYEKTGTSYEIPLQRKLDKMQTAHYYYPAMEGSTPDGETYNSLTFVTNKITEPYSTAAIATIIAILVEQESGMIKNELIKEGICTSIESFPTNGQQNTITIVGLDCKSGTADKFREIIDRCFRKAAEEGLDKDSVNAILNRIEFALRESNDAQQGIKYNMSIIPNWIFGVNPIDVLEQNIRFEELKEKIAGGLLEDTIRKYLIDNTHSLLCSFEPKQGLAIEHEAEIQRKLDEYKASLPKEEIQRIVDENIELDRYQNTPDTPEQLKCIPTLKLSDLNPESVDYPVIKDCIDGVETYRYHYNTNGIAYVRYIFDLRALPVELLQYGSLIADLYGLMPTKNYTFGELDKTINTYTGGCGSNNDVYTRVSDYKREAFAELKFHGRSLIKNIGKMTDLIIEIATNTIFDDIDRLRDVITRQTAEATMELNYNAYQYARDRIHAQYNPASYLNEELSGIDYYLFLKDLNDNFEQKSAEIVANLKKTQDLLIHRDNLKCFVYCKEDDYPLYAEQAKRFIASMNTMKSTFHEWNIKQNPHNEAIIMPSKVQYVLKAYDLLPDHFEWSGTHFVFSKMLSSDYLQTNIRVRGGAYGSWGSMTTDGIMLLSSYRDPNLQRTIDAYDNIPNYLRDLDIDDDAMTKYIIGTIASKDMPVATSQRGRTALSRYRQGVTFEDVKRERAQILGTTPQQIRDLITIMEQVRDHGTICVLGGEEKIMECKDKFDKIIRL